VPALAVGFALDAIPLLTAGAIVLEAAVVLGSIQAVRAARFAFTDAAWREHQEASGLVRPLASH
jgi:hypothetical protein